MNKCMVVSVALTTMLFASATKAATLTDDEAMATPCRAYLASRGSAIYGALQDAVTTRLLGSPQARRFGSSCNMADYVAAECKSHRGDDVRRAIDRLERAGADGKLPSVGPCGAF